MVAVDERGEFFCAFVIFFLFFIFDYCMRFCLRILCELGLLSFSVRALISGLSFFPFLVGALLWVGSLFFYLEADMFCSALLW